ncbi:MAG TPA: hypothetical protein VE998_07625, partial [Terriglobales bacterium]|nr:hypothetical protein [Terriglobales bacterium]
CKEPAMSAGVAQAFQVSRGIDLSVITRERRRGHRYYQEQAQGHAKKFFPSQHMNSACRNFLCWVSPLLGFDSAAGARDVTH